MAFDPDDEDRNSYEDDSPYGSSTSEERRVQRSSRRQEALAYQLQHVQDQLSLEAMVLCDDFGEVVASAGTPKVIANLSSQVPWLVATPPAQFGRSLGYLWEVCPDLDEERIMLYLVTVEGQTEPLLLCGIGEPTGLAAGVPRVARGVDRIIRTTLN